MPEKALEISAAALKHLAADPRILAALHTTRGGAHRDMEQRDRAAECAHEAIRLSPQSFHPWNLLGAVYYGRGNPARGDECFQKALALGASPRMQEAEIRGALKRSDLEVRRTVASYLIGKDPVRYAWAGVYLQQQG